MDRAHRHPCREVPTWLSSLMTSVANAGLLCLDVGGPDDRRPSGDFALDQRAQRLLPAARLVRHDIAELAQPLLYAAVIEGLVERFGELLENGGRSSFWGEQREPGGGLVLRKPGFRGRRHVRQRRIGGGRRYRI